MVYSEKWRVGRNKMKKRLYIEELKENNPVRQLEEAKNKIAALEVELEKERSLNALYKQMFEDRKENL